MLQRRTERTQLDAFLCLSKVACMSQQLVIERNTNYPYKTFGALRDPEKFDELAATPRCVLDACTENFVRFYEGDLASGMSQSELQLILALADSDTVSTERAHSVNSMTVFRRKHTTKLDLPTLSAFAVGRSAREPYALQSSSSAPEAQVPRRRPRGKEGEAPKKRRGGGGAWRAWVHIQGAGHHCTPAFFRELSERLHALGPEDRAYYDELGRLGTHLHRANQRAFAQRPRQRQAGQRRPQLEDLGGDEDADDDGDGPRPEAQQGALVALPAR